MSLKYDATGTQDDFTVTETFVVFQENQTVRLKDAAFFKVFDDNGNEPRREDGTTYSLIIRTLTQEDTVVTRSDPIPQIDPTTESILLWEPVEDQEDIQAKSDLLLHVNNANEANSLCNVIRLNKIFKGQRLRVEITYQRYKRSVYDETPEAYDATGPRYSPAMMQNVLDRLDTLEAKPTAFANMFGTYLGNEDILEEDLTGIAPENFVRYEKHDVNVPAGITVLQPAKGAFYPEGLEILKMEKTPFTLTSASRALGLNKLFFYSDTEATVNAQYHISTERKIVLSEENIDMLLQKFGGTVSGQLVDILDTEVTLLQKDVDYIVDDIDITRTARTHSSSAVYKHIRFLTEVSGEVLISYHAFGGFVATSDIRAMNREIGNTREILNNTGLLTEEGVAKLPLLVQIIKRLRIIERYHNHFHSVEHRIFVKGAKGIHWFNFAAIYDVDWGLLLNNIHDLGHFRIHSMLRDWTYEFMVDVDVTRDIKDALQVKVLATNNTNYDPTKGYSKVFKRDNLLARICWVDEGERSGVVLQLGWDLSVYDKENYPVDVDCVSIINKSGSTSFWTLLTGDEVNQPVEGQVMVYNHTPFTLTADPVFQRGKAYFIYKNRYLYFRTCDKYIKEGRGYYAIQEDGSYADVTSVVTPGAPVTDYMGDDGKVNLFERMVYGNYLALAEVIPGEQVPLDTYYEPDVDVYKEDKVFTMPNTNFVWNIESANSHYTVMPMCCTDGLVAWIGNINLTQFAAGEGDCHRCEECDYSGAESYDTVASYKCRSGLSLELQKWVDIRSVKTIDMVVFDRVDGRYLVCPASTQHIYDGDLNVGCTVQLSANDQCWATLQVAKKNDVIKMELAPYLGTFSRVNERYDLRQIRMHF